MDFTFSEDQLLFRDSVRDFLVNEVTPERIRASWDSESGRDDALWNQLAEMGLTGLTVPEDFGGLGMSELDFVLLAEQCGYVALPEPLVNSAMIALPLLTDLGGELAEHWLPLAASGEARVIAAIDDNLVVEDAHVADLLLLTKDDAVYALNREQYSSRHNASVDPSRRLFTVQINDGVKPLVQGDSTAALLEATLNRGALAAAAQCLGLAQKMVDLSVDYTSDRQQFGKPIGSFQAVKHHMANVAVRLEYAKPTVHRAAFSVATGHSAASRHVSQAKLAASEAANLAAKNAIQVHGAMGYTWEVDLHLFMKKAWALAGTWGDAGFHKSRVMDYLLDDNAVLGSVGTFQ